MCSDETVIALHSLMPHHFALCLVNLCGLLALCAHHGVKLFIVDLTISVHIDLIQQKLKMWFYDLCTN